RPQRLRRARVPCRQRLYALHPLEAEGRRGTADLEAARRGDEARVAVGRLADLVVEPIGVTDENAGEPALRGRRDAQLVVVDPIGSDLVELPLDDRGLAVLLYHVCQLVGQQLPPGPTRQVGITSAQVDVAAGR